MTFQDFFSVMYFRIFSIFCNRSKLDGQKKQEKLPAGQMPEDLKAILPRVFSLIKQRKALFILKGRGDEGGGDGEGCSRVTTIF